MDSYRVGDVVTLSFKGFNALSEGDPVAGAAFSQSVTLDEDAALKGCRCKVEHAALLAIELGRAEARYEVSSPNGRVMSQKADVYVDMRTPAAGCQAFPTRKDRYLPPIVDSESNFLLCRKWLKSCLFTGTNT
jgi:hypothetical protein